MLYFLKERRRATRNLEKDLFLGHLQPGVGKNTKDLAILILEFDDVTVKTIYISSWIYENDTYNLGAWVRSLLSIRAG